MKTSLPTLLVLRRGTVDRFTNKQGLLSKLFCSCFKSFLINPEFDPSSPLLVLRGGTAGRFTNKQEL